MSNKVLQFPIADLITPTTCNRNPLCLLDDIDHYEHSILMYLASTHHSDNLLDAAVDRSVNQISLMAKISKSTVRVRLRSLVAKGYLRLEHQYAPTSKSTKRHLANRYIFTRKVVEVVEAALSECEITTSEKIAVGQSHTSITCTLSDNPAVYSEAETVSEAQPEVEVPSKTEAPAKIAEETPPPTPCSEDKINDVKSATEQILAKPKLSLSLTPVHIPGIEPRPVPADRQPPANACEIIRRCRRLLELYPDVELIQSRITTLIQTAQMAKFHVALSIYNRYDHLYVD